MAQLLGRDAPLYVLAQAASGVAASGDFNPITYYSLDPGFSQSEDDDSRIGAALHNAVDRQAPVLGQIDLSPNFTIPFCLANIGFWLPHFFKVTTPTGSGPYTHIFTSGATDHAGASLVWVDGEKYKCIHTFVGSNFDIDLGQGSGYAQMSISGNASNIETLSSSPLGTPAAKLTEQIISAASGCVIKHNGTVLSNVTGGKLSFQRNLEPHRPAGQAEAIATEFTPSVGASLEGSFDLRVVDHTFQDYARSNQTYPYEFEFKIDDNNTLVLSCPAVRFSPSERGVGDDGLRTETVAFKAEQTSSAAMVTLKLINSVPAYSTE